jgi:hypothetical protein
MRSNIYKLYRPILDNLKKGLKQQLFLEKYVEHNYNSIDRFLLYHGIGTGKTRSSIIIAEKIISMNPKMKAIIILPARLKTNYLDELIPIICADYKTELKQYNDPKTPEKDKKKLRIIFNNKIKRNYTIVSYEKITNEFKKSTNIKETLKSYTKDKILIIDEFHNLISNYVDETSVEKINTINKIPPTIKNIRSVVMRYISRYADKSCKIFFLTATPVFDNYHQFVELVKLLNVNPIADSKYSSLRELIPYIQNKVSYYADENRKDFPKVEYKTEEIPFSKSQDVKTYDIQNNESDEENDDNKEMFLVKQRQVSISVYGFDKVDKVMSNLAEYAPKLLLLFKYIEETDTGKHLVYSNFITYCLYLIKKYLDMNGWVDYNAKNKTTEYKPYKTYVLWDASLNDTNKQIVKSVLNSVENMDGKIIKVILGSPSIKEGISFKHIQHLHQIDPVWNSSAKDQVEGRCIRYKSHEDIPLTHQFLKQTVIIHNYKSVPIPNEKGAITETCDQKIYDRIIPQKHILIHKITQLLQKVAIDYYLYKKLLKSPDVKTSSDISINSSDNIYLHKRKINKEPGIKNTCPKLRRPIDGKCKQGYEIKMNAQNNACCYKSKIGKKETKVKNVKKEKKSKEITITGFSYNNLKLDGTVTKITGNNIKLLKYNNINIDTIITYILDNGWIPLLDKTNKFTIIYKKTKEGYGFVFDAIRTQGFTNYTYKNYFIKCKMLVEVKFFNNIPKIQHQVINTTPKLTEFDSFDHWFDTDIIDKTILKENKKKIAKLLTIDMPIIADMMTKYKSERPITIKQIDIINKNNVIINCSWIN